MQYEHPEQDKPVPPDSALWPWLVKSGLAYLAWDRACAQWMHRATVWPAVVLFFRGVSALSDGIIWYVTIPCLALFGGPQGMACMLRMVGMGLTNLVIYKLLKHSTGRQRPFKTCPGIRVCANPLDEYSFPSGHTLHAVAFGIMLSSYYPAMSWPLAVLAMLVSLSRVILGLHYPSDVLMGACIGAVSAWGFHNLG